MKLVFKTLCSTFALALGLTATTLHAEEQAEPAETTKPRALLFKIHDIQPVLNADGVVTDCDFTVTFFNRTTDSFRQAKLNLGWKDDVSARYLEDEQPQKEEAPVQPTRRQSPRQSQQEAAPVMDFSVSVNMPSLGAYKQASVKASVKTEKCFLLLDNVNFKVETCNMLNKGAESESNSRRSRLAADKLDAECASLFEYVDSKNPEYYDEFKNISYSEQAKQLSEEKSQENSDIQKSYSRVMNNLTQAGEALKNIK